MSKPVDGSLAAYAATGNQAADQLVAEHKRLHHDVIASVALFALYTLVTPGFAFCGGAIIGGIARVNFFIPIIATSAVLNIAALTCPIYMQYVVYADHARKLEERFDERDVQKDLQRMHDRAAFYLGGVESRTQRESSLKEDAAALLPKQADE